MSIAARTSMEQMTCEAWRYRVESYRRLGISDEQIIEGLIEAIALQSGEFYDRLVRQPPRPIIVAGEYQWPTTEEPKP